MGTPDLYDLNLEFRQYDHVVDAARPAVRHPHRPAFRDDDEQYPGLGRGGSFYLKVNGRDFLVRGATYTPDLLFKYDPDRETAILRT